MDFNLHAGLNSYHNLMQIVCLISHQNMENQIKTLVEALKRLPEDLQDLYNKQFMADIKDDLRWEAIFESPESQEGLARHEVCIMREIA